MRRHLRHCWRVWHVFFCGHVCRESAPRFYPCRYVASVFAIEPDQANLGYLRRNIEMSGSVNIKVVEKAAHSSCGYLTFYRHRVNGMWSQLAEPSESAFMYTKVSIPSTTIDVELGIAGVKASIVKIDAEGDEFDILEGMNEQIPSCSLWVIETRQAIILRRMLSYGYRLGWLPVDSISLNPKETLRLVHGMQDLTIDKDDRVPFRNYVFWKGRSLQYYRLS
jgi:FkbM family methyltransferase